MEERIQFEAREVARRLLRSFRASYPQWRDDCTPLEAITEWLELDIATFHHSDEPEGTYGYLDAHDNLIWLRRDLPDTLRRFTLAHELGHALLHRTVSPHMQPLFESIHAISAPSTTDQGASQTDPCSTEDVREEVNGPLFQ